MQQYAVLIDQLTFRKSEYLGKHGNSTCTILLCGLLLHIVGPTTRSCLLCIQRRSKSFMFVNSMRQLMVFHLCSTREKPNTHKQ